VNLEACTEIGIMYRDSNGIPQNYTQITLYYNSWGVERYSHEYAKVSREAPELGHDLSQYGYGIALRDRRGVEQNRTEALQYSCTGMVMELNRIKHIIILYTLLYITALKWFPRVSEFRRDGLGVEQDSAEAIKHLQPTKNLPLLTRKSV
jgi:hypothetical protein